MQIAGRSTESSSNVRARLPALKTFFNRRWWWTTLLVLVGIAVLARLGVWQLDRREQRRARNDAIIQQLALPPLALNSTGLPDGLEALKNRLATASGEYDLSRQVALMHQNWTSAPGFHLITPLVIAGASPDGDERLTAVLVDRGWLPAAALPQEHWGLYDVTEPVTVTGYIKLSQTASGARDEVSASIEPRSEWYRVDVASIEGQMPYELLPIFLQEGPPETGDSELPFRSELDRDLSEGNHLSYAIQWFIFAAILAGGYVAFVGKRSEEPPDDAKSTALEK